jgi:hypothetical protein
MKMFEVIFIDFRSVIMFADSKAEIRAKCPTAIRINQITIH